MARGKFLAPRRSPISFCGIVLPNGDWHANNTGAMLDGLASRIEHYMDLLSTRQKLVASNIANADTPGYKTRDIDFQEEFQNAMTTGAPAVIEAPGLKIKNDGNNVSMDRESRLLAENALRFQIATELMRSEIQTLHSAIQEGSGT